jgi:hypothetical protein
MEKNTLIQTKSLPTKSEVQLENAPNFNLLDYDGKTVSLADFVGNNSSLIPGRYGILYLRTISYFSWYSFVYK